MITKQSQGHVLGLSTPQVCLATSRNMRACYDQQYGYNRFTSVSLYLNCVLLPWLDNAFCSSLHQHLTIASIREWHDWSQRWTSQWKICGWIRGFRYAPHEAVGYMQASSRVQAGHIT